MSKIIEQLIGKHPDLPDFFAEWLECEDMPIPIDNPNKKHRKLTAQPSELQKGVEQTAFWVIKHHVSPNKLDFLKSKRKLDTYSKYFEEDFIQNQKLIPKITANTKRGVLAEVLMNEYLQKTTGFTSFINKL